MVNLTDGLQSPGDGSPERRGTGRQRGSLGALSIPGIAWLALLLSLVMSALAWYAIRTGATAAAQERFTFRVEAATKLVHQQLAQYSTMLQGAEALYATDDYVSNQEWRTYMGWAFDQAQFQAIRYLGYARSVPHAQLGDETARARRDGLDGFRILPEGARSEYLPVTHVWPLNDYTRGRQGHDLLTDTRIGPALLEARVSGHEAMLRLSGILSEHADGAPEVDQLVIFHPLYRNGALRDSPEHRPAAFRGFLFAVLDVDGLMQDVLQGRNERVALRVYDGPRARPDALIHTSTNLVAKYESMFVTQQELYFGGRRLTLEFQSTPFNDILAGSDRANLIAILGLLIGLLLFGVLRTQGQRRQAEEQANQLFSTSIDPLCFATPDGGFRRVNPAFTQVLGYSDRSASDRSLPDIAHEEDRASVLEALRGITRENPTARFEARCLHQDGSQHRLLAWSARLGDTEEVLYLAARDITVDRERELALRLSEERLAVTLHSIGDGVMVTDATGRVTLLNAIAEDLTGWTLQEAAGLHVDQVFRIINEETRQPAIVPVTDALRTGTIHGLANHTVLIARDGSERAIADSCAPIRIRGGEILGAVLVFRDVTDERSAERALAARNTEMSALLNTLSDAVVTADGQGIILSANPATETVLGYAPAELLGRNVAILAAEPHQSRHGEYMTRYQESGESRILGSVREVDGHHKDGRNVPLDIIVSPYSVGDEQRFVGLIRDISDRRKVMQELQEARRQAELASRAKSDFLAAMSHELRTPMHGVLGMIDVLHQSSLRADQVEMAELIRDSANTLRRIIDDILDLSKIEAGRLELEQVPFSPGEVIERTAAMMNRIAARAHVHFTVFVDPMLPDQVIGDALRLRQVMINLTSNAIKFSSGNDRRGRVALRATLAERGPEHVRIDFTVADNGIGIEESVRAKLFEPFAQADASTTRRYGGTGLGLAISRQLVDLMGGEISVQSKADEGSTFTVCLPLVVAQLGRQVGAVVPGVAGLSCVVIGPPGPMDDIAAYLRHAGAVIKRAKNPVTARRHSGSGDGEPLVWILDAATATNATEALLEMSQDRMTLDIRMVAVLSDRNDQGAAQQFAGDVTILDGNALSRRALFDAVARAAGRTVQSTEDDVAGRTKFSGKAPSREEALQQGRLILVAEDNETNQKVIVRQLGLLGQCADVVANGREALERWAKGEYALILTDLHMPELDGHELAIRIRAEESSTRRIPILALTANALPEEARRCREAGMDDYLTKPLALADLEAALERWMPGDTQFAAAEPAGHLATLDIRVLQGLVGDDPDVIRDFLGEFQATTAPVIAEMNEALAAVHFSAIGQCAHKIKSSARAMGALLLGELCAAAEQASRTQDAAALESLARRIAQEMRAVNDRVDAIRRDLLGNSRPEGNQG